MMHLMMQWIGNALFEYMNSVVGARRCCVKLNYSAGPRVIFYQVAKA